MNTQDQILTDEKLVYIKPVDVAALRDVPELADTPDGTTVYSVHLADGRRVALMGDRDAAFVGARQYDMTPVDVH
ncbi:MAG: DUF1150 family protein [Alphaproteobacteria bacterium]